MERGVGSVGGGPGAGTSRRDDLVAALLAAWMVLGLVVDGWNHINLQDGRLGAFITPWHGILYAGFTASALWLMTRGQVRGEWSLVRVPAAYRVGILGIGLATFSVAGDSVWHTLFGVEADVARMLAPFHLGLYTGVALVATCAFRSAWLRLPERPTAREFLPGLISFIAVLTLFGFVVQFLSPFMTWFPASVALRARGTAFVEVLQVAEIGGILVWTALLLGPSLLVLRRWRLPFGTVTVALVAMAAAVAAMTEFTRGTLFVAAASGGLTIDIITACVSDQRRAFRTAGVLAPVTMWTTSYALLAWHYGVTWPLEIWGGAVGAAGLAGLGISLLVAPPAWAAQPARRQPLTAAPSLGPFVQRLADLVGRSEAISDAGPVVWETARAAASLRQALGRLPVDLRPRLSADLDAFERLVPSAELDADLRDAVAGAAAALTVDRIGIDVSAEVRAVLFNLTARAERILVGSRTLELIDQPLPHAAAAAALRHLGREPHVIDLSAGDCLARPEVHQ